MIRDGRSSALLFSGSTAKAGDTITLNDSVDNYRFLLIRFSNSWMHALCPILDGDRSCTAVRGSHTNISATNSFTVWSVDGDYAGNKVTIDNCYSANVKSGSVRSQHEQYRIYGGSDKWQRANRRKASPNRRLRKRT